MNSTQRVSVSVEVELGDEIERCLTPQRSEVERRLTKEVAELGENLGLPCALAGTTAPGRSSRAVRIRVDGRIVPYPLAIQRRTWLDVAMPSLRDLPLADETPDSVDPDDWLRRHAASAEGEDDADTVAAYVTRLAVETLALHPESLLPDAAAIAYLAPDAADSFEAGDARRVLAPLLELGCSLRDRDEIRRLVLACRAAGRSVDDTVEEVFGRLREPQLEVFAHPEFLGLPPGTPSVSIEHHDLAEDLRTFGFALQRHLMELGVSRPVVLTPREELHHDYVRVRVNDRLGPPIPLARHGEVAVQVSPRILARAGFEGRVLIDAASGHRLLAVPEAEARRVRAEGFTPLSATAFMAVAVAREVTPLADRLLDIEEVERDLADLERTHRPLVRAALRRFSPARVAQVCRGLLREQVSSRDLWTILNTLLRFEAMPLPPPGVRLFDSRLPLRDSQRPLEQVPVDDLVCFIRLQMPQRLAYDAGLRGEQLTASTLPVYDADAGVELLLRQRMQDPVWDANRDDELRRDVGRVLVRAGAPADSVIMVPPTVRAALRDVLADEFPSVRVLATNEVPPGTAIRARGTIALSSA